MKSPVNQRAKYKALNLRLAKYVAIIQNIYEQLNKQVAMSVYASGYTGEEPFKFAKHPLVNAALNGILKEFRESISATIYSGTSKEWHNSNEIQDLLANKVLKMYGATVNDAKYKVYYQPNNDSLKAFQQRKDNGMSLSKKIWNQSLNYKAEMEYAISSAVEKGTSAVTLSKRLSKYLNDFPSLKKDYKEKFGTAVDCHDCEYRSIRLARSEINMAYRTAEQKRWEQMDFVVGYEIKLSTSHHDRMPHGDICDTLAGKYPKDFKWTGWHPNDMCYCIPILKTEDEFFDLDNESSENEVTDYPESFKLWIEENSDKIRLSEITGTLPYWIKDNKGLISYTAYNDVPKLKADTHIQGRYEEKQAFINYKIRTNNTNDVFSKEQEINHKNIEEAINLKRGEIMHHYEADNGNVNPNYRPNREEYNSNCQVCVYVYELRRRGFDLYSVPHYDEEDTMPYKLGNNTLLGFINPKPKTLGLNKYKEVSEKQFNKVTEKQGRYHISWDWNKTDANGKKYGHILTAERLPNGKLIIYDPQDDSYWPLDFLKKTFDGIQVVRVDNLCFNVNVIKEIVTKTR